MHDLLDLDTMPPQLPARTKLLQELGRIFAPFASSQNVDLEVVGPTGSGKTTTVKAFLAALPAALAWPGNLDHVVVNCTPGLRPSGVLVAILRTFSPAYPGKGFSLQAMMEDLANLLKTRGKPLVVVLDDHHWMRNGDEILTALAELRLRRQLALSLIVVRETPLEGQSGMVRVVVKPYTAAQAREVVTCRAREALMERSLSPGAIEAIAQVCLQGGMKRAMLALRSCRETLQTKPRVTRPDATRLAKDTDARFNQFRLEPFSDHHLFILRALVLSPHAMRSRRLRDAYSIEAESRHEKPLANVQFLKYVTQLARSGFLDVKPLRGGVPGGALSVELVCQDRHVALAEVEKALDKRGA